MSREGPDKSSAVQITTVTMFTGHVWSRIGHIQKTSLEFGGGTGQVRCTGLALEWVQSI
jgi:hypothetical protein